MGPPEENKSPAAQAAVAQNDGIWKYLLAAALLIAVAAFGVWHGCGKGAVKKITSTKRYFVLVHNTAETTAERGRLICALRGPLMQNFLESQGHELEILDAPTTTSDGDKAPILVKLIPQLGKVTLPALFVLDKESGELLSVEAVPNGAGVEIVQKHCQQKMPPVFADVMTAADDEKFAEQMHVDCDFTQCPQYTPGDKQFLDELEKHGRLKAGREDEKPDAGAEAKQDKLGQGQREGRLPVFGDGPVFEDSVPVISRDQWAALIREIDAAGGGLDNLVTRIFNQGQEGSCVANATTQSHQVLQAVQFGRGRVVQLSPISLYKRIGSSPGSGAMVSDGLKEMVKRGILPLNTDENKAEFAVTMQATGFYTKFPSDWEKTAKLFRGQDYFEIRSVDGFVTALLKGYPVVYGRAGHCICAVRPVMKNGVLYVKYANSWGDWGDHGFGYDSESMVRSGASWAFALRSVVIPVKEVKKVTLAQPVFGEAEQEYALAP